MEPEAASPTAQTKRARNLIWFKRALYFALTLAISVALLKRTDPPLETKARLATRVLMRDKLGDIDAGIAQAIKDKRLGAQPRLTLKVEADHALLPEVRERLKGLSSGHVEPKPDAPKPPEGTLTIKLKTIGQHQHLEVRLAPDLPQAKTSTTDKPLVDAKRRLGSWSALLPPLIAVLMALYFKQLLLALGMAVWLGAALETSFMPHTATWFALSHYLWGTLISGFNLYVIGFTVSLVGMVHVMLRMGGLAGLLEQLSKVAKGARSTRLATALMGMAIFFDDYANTVVVGSTMRPLSDARLISREKLAYLVDSTSAPVAGLAIISTWIGYEVGLFSELATQLELNTSGYAIFFEILPLRFYCLLTLGFVIINSLMGRDFGPMLKAERRALTGEVLREGSTPLTHVALESLAPEPEAPKRWYNAVIPIFFVINAAMLGMFWSGWRGQGGANIPSLQDALWGGSTSSALARAWQLAAPDMLRFTAWREALSSADNAKVLCISAVLGSLLAIGLATTQRLLSLRQASIAWLRAIPGMRMAIAILVLAWAIRSVCDDLGTSLYLVGAIDGLLSPQWLPMLTFALAAIVAFSTGTSWGTMGILLPAMIPLAHMMTQGMAQGPLLLLLCFGAVLDGAIFGDHCSPISDTTVMSSIASGVDHLDHVRTQLPYATLTMAAAAGFGYIGVAFGLPSWAALVLGLGSLALWLRIVGKPNA